MSKTIFLSAVTHEFGGVRKRLGAVCTRTKRLHVRHQDDFVQRGVLTLHMLEEEIRKSELVAHVIGAEFGSAPPIDQVDNLLRRLPDFETRFPEVAVCARQGEISYTQWEAWLALYFQSLPGSPMRLCRYEVVDSRTYREPLQAAHLERLRQGKIYPQEVSSGCDPVDEVLLSLIELGYLTEAESQRIVHLPYPSLGTLFKGREAFLDQLRQSLQRGVRGAATAITGKAVHGLGGVGKTRLAVEYAWQHADQYSAVLFVTADSPESMRQNLAELTGPLVLNLPEQTAPEEEIRVAAALRWLHEHPGWFLILDNVDTEVAAAYAEELLARLHGGQVLITSRLGKWSGCVEPLELDVLDTAAAARFLLERTQPNSSGRGRLVQPADDASATELARELDGLALALEQASAYICQSRISLAEYLQRWRSHVADVQSWNDRTMKYPKSVAVTWQTTLDQLRVDEVVLLHVLAWLAPEPIPLGVLNHLAFESLISLRPFCRHSTAAGISESTKDTVPNEVGGDFGNIRKLLANLADYSMIRWDSQADSITVHRVVQEILRTRQTQSIPVLTATLKLLSAATPAGNPGDVRTWPQWEPLRPHVAFAVAEADHRDIAEPTTLLMGQLGSLLSSKALHGDAERWERRALAIDENVFGQNSTEAGVRLNNLAQTLKATNRLAEAEPLMRRALDIDEQSYGDNHPEVAIDLNNLAALLQNTNRLAEAEPLVRRALAIDERSYGGEHPAVARDLNNLAQLLKATNRLTEAEPLMTRVVSIFERSLGENHPNVATALNNLAVLFQDTNRPAEAEPLMRRALAIDEQSYGDEHPEVATDLNNLAQLLQDTNRLAEAEPLMARMVTIFAQFGHQTGHEHPHMQTAIRNYRRLLAAMNIPDDEVDQRLGELTQ